MNYSVIFHPVSDEDYQAAYAWYEEQQTGLGNQFETAVDDLIRKISHNPELFGFRHRPYREAKVENFPFTIVYKVNTAKRIVYISAIYHTSRNPEKKYRD